MKAERREVFICWSLGHFPEGFTENMASELGLEGETGRSILGRHIEVHCRLEKAHTGAGLGTVFPTLVLVLGF